MGLLLKPADAGSNQAPDSRVFGFLGWGLGLEHGICSVGWCLELKRLLQFSGFKI